MKRTSLFILFCFLFVRPAAGQDTTDYVQQTRKSVLIILNDGSQKMGFLISDDGSNVMIETAALGLVTIPKYQIKEIRTLNSGEKVSTYTWTDEAYSNRYFFTFNGLPRKNKNTLKVFPLGIDAQFGIGKNLQLGGLTSWVGAPLIATVQYRFDLAKDFYGAVGVYAGTSSWVAFASDNPGAGVVPYGSLTYGTHESNFMVGYGYGYLNIGGDSGGASLIMLGGTAAMGKKASFVFESILTVGQGSINGTVTPGVRWHYKSGSAFQFGLAAFVADGEFFPVPIPAVSWSKTLD